jgi:hypothetical protein
MDQPPITICHIIPPVPFIIWPIRPYLPTSSMLLTFLPLALIHRLIRLHIRA